MHARVKHPGIHIVLFARALGSLVYGLMLSVAILLTGCSGNADVGPVGDGEALRVATFNIEDVRTDDIINDQQPRLITLAGIIHRVHPDIILLNEIAYDQPDVPGYDDSDAEGQNGQWFANNFIHRLNEDAAEPLHYHAFMAPSNTGISSGYDLDNNGRSVTVFPDPEGADEDGLPGGQTAAGRAYGGDSWGFGTFPGQYAMALLVRDKCDILYNQVRTFQKFPWSAMPGALAPVDPENSEPWYDDEEWKTMPLSSKSHWDVPVRTASGQILHLLCSHPTPPVFDGKEKRNQRRNHDEIRFWADYIDNKPYIVDDQGRRGGLPAGAHFVILGDLNADPQQGASLDNPVGKFLFSHYRVNGNLSPAVAAPAEDRSAGATSQFGLRVDYVLPSTELEVTASGIWYDPAIWESDAKPSDHFPVWVDLLLK